MKLRTFALSKYFACNRIFVVGKTSHIPFEIKTEVPPYKRIMSIIIPLRLQFVWHDIDWPINRIQSLDGLNFPKLMPMGAVIIEFSLL